MAWRTSKNPCVAGWQLWTRGFWFFGLLHVTSFISKLPKADRGISVRKHGCSHLQHVRLFDTLWIINTRDNGPGLPLPCLGNYWLLCCHVLYQHLLASWDVCAGGIGRWGDGERKYSRKGWKDRSPTNFVSSVSKPSFKISKFASNS